MWIAFLVTTDGRFVELAKGESMIAAIRAGLRKHDPETQPGVFDVAHESVIDRIRAEFQRQTPDSEDT